MNTLALDVDGCGAALMFMLLHCIHCTIEVQARLVIERLKLGDNWRLWGERFRRVRYGVHGAYPEVEISSFFAVARAKRIGTAVDSTQSVQNNLRQMCVDEDVTVHGLQPLSRCW